MPHSSLKEKFANNYLSDHLNKSLNDKKTQCSLCRATKIIKRIVLQNSSVRNADGAHVNNIPQKPYNTYVDYLEKLSVQRKRVNSDFLL